MGKLPSCCGLVSVTANYLCRVADKSATSCQQVCCNGIWEITRHNRHNGLLPAPTCCGHFAELSFMLWTCCCGLVTGETGVMDFFSELFNTMWILYILLIKIYFLMPLCSFLETYLLACLIDYFTSSEEYTK